jgi:hypothetical protein
MPDQFLQILQQALLRNSKSTVLTSLSWLIGLLLPSIILASAYATDKWIVVMLGILLGIAVLLFLAAFVYFACKNPELLRSEKYVIQKMAIEQGLIGDDLSGYVKIDPKSQKLITGSSSESVPVKVE